MISLNMLDKTRPETRVLVNAIAEIYLLRTGHNIPSYNEITEPDQILNELWGKTDFEGASAPPTFLDKIKLAINQHSIENRTNTPDFILAEYLSKCLDTFEWINNRREQWYGKGLTIGGIMQLNPETGAELGVEPMTKPASGDEELIYFLMKYHNLDREKAIETLEKVDIAKGIANMVKYSFFDTAGTRKGRSSSASPNLSAPPPTSGLTDNQRLARELMKKIKQGMFDYKESDPIEYAPNWQAVIAAALLSFLNNNPSLSPASIIDDFSGGDLEIVDKKYSTLDGYAVLAETLTNYYNSL